MQYQYYATIYTDKASRLMLEYKKCCFHIVIENALGKMGLATYDIFLFALLRVQFYLLSLVSGQCWHLAL